jgi:NADH-quinone oxidoreductase subunit N
VNGTNENPAALLPELFLLGAAVVGLLLGAWLPRDEQWLVRLLAAAAALAGLVATAVAAGRPDELVFGAAYAVDTPTHATRAIVLVAVLGVLALSVDATTGHRRETEFVVLLQLGALGAILLGGANDLLLLVAAFLLASVPFYALAGWDASRLGTEAALKYYLSGAFLGVAMLAGVALLSGVGGATGYGSVRDGLAAAPVAAAGVGLVAVLGGLLFKVGGVPGHFWVPDVTDGTPPAVAAIVTTIPKVGGLVALYRLVSAAVPADALDRPLLVAVIAAVTMTLGNLAAFFQTTVQRLLAYSTIGQAGFLLIAVAVADRADLAQPALLYYAAGYAVTNVGAFAVVAAFPRARTLDDHRGMARRTPALAVALTVCLLGLIGTPPTAVFVGKLVVFTAAVDGGFAWLAVLAVVNTVASVFYYLRWIAPVFGATGPGAAPLPEGRWAAGTAYVCAALAVGFGLLGGVVLPLLAAPPIAW